MHEAASREPNTSTLDMREYLKLHALPPENTQVWMGRHRGNLNFDKKAANFDITRDDQPWVQNAETRRVLLCVLVFYGLAIFSRTVDGDGVAPTLVDEAKWISIWPISESVRWPPDRVVSDSDVENVRMQVSSNVKLPHIQSMIRRPELPGPRNP
jgi:hypothetical protein